MIQNFNDPAPGFIITPRRKALIERYKRWLERHAPVWDEKAEAEYRKSLLPGAGEHSPGESGKG